jgi:hypothetical protein
LTASEITPYLYIAADPQAEDIDSLRPLDLNLIISMIFEKRPAKALNQLSAELLWLRTFDFVLLPIPVKTLNRGVQKALPLIQQGGRVLVFCHAGRHRSVAMASCILIGMGYSASKAMQLISQRREIADPYAWHIRRQIEKYEASK